ncbi:ABC transporter G family member 23 [Condylostylus longicornis]|uniref:ABC transporter G family member 23 n=1 Tax=Condylostylus longicornis TaxID=2530218 RepID=UPI00244DEFCD|nr:ABC transporter G family member 23 [Condylostylus longicornis]XP_055376991.1 ABC transporter G family member 23 [Condylostylus longicornis]
MAVVEVRNGFKYYGNPKKPAIILNGLNMTVMRSSIYGLLGASGCGKTTLLSCIVGQRQLNSGEIKVLGLKPGLPGSGIPGPRVGYMPQDIALVEQMSIKEIIWYFGRIYGMTDEDIFDKFIMLKNLLELPPPQRLIGNCSGGQQRRVSFACAMIHIPEILILDEPTVGLDPILRERIWDFLVEITKTTKCAIIITTHYIEEARQANCIGLMRSGVLLAENSPEEILTKYGCNSIEDAFLLLSQKQGKSDEAQKSIIKEQTQNSNTPIQVITSETNEKIATLQTGEEFRFKKRMSFQEQRAPGFIGTFHFTSTRRMKALLAKNWVQFVRQSSSMAFVFIFPLLSLIPFFLAIGKTPKGIEIGIVNEEASLQQCYDETLVTVTRFNDSCEFSKISCRFMQNIDQDITIPVYYSSEAEAYKAANEAQVAGYIRFSHNFSEAMQSVLDERQFTEDWNINNFQILVRLDMSDQQIAYHLERKLHEAYKSFMQDIMVDCGIPKHFANIPVHFLKPIYGSFDEEYQKFIIPGILITIVFFIVTLTTASTFISERADGIWDRTLVAGISTSEMLLAHIISQSLIVIIQCFEVIFFVAFVFNVQSNGDSALLIWLLVSIGFCGMLFGLLISIYSTSHTVANFVTTGAFYPMIILSGILWPLEGMNSFLRHAVKLLPFTLPIISARNIIEKGWSITDLDVSKGFIAIGIWIFIFAVLCVFGLRRRS